jgi:DNA-3-methyladenine glycosylase
MKVNADYYQNEDVLFLARDLIGKVLCTNIHHQLVKGLIVETEAYNGVDDRACHAFGGRKTKRNEAMFQNGGIAYVYLCYGLHHLFNVVTSVENDPKAVLIRGIVPIEGIEIVFERRKNKQSALQIGIGPGKTSQCMGITTELNTASLTGIEIWIEDYQITVETNEIHVGPRVGVEYAGADALLPYRYQWLKPNRDFLSLFT